MRSTEPLGLPASPVVGSDRMNQWVSNERMRMVTGRGARHPVFLAAWPIPGEPTGCGPQGRQGWAMQTPTSHLTSHWANASPSPLWQLGVRAPLNCQSSLAAGPKEADALAVSPAWSPRLICVEGGCETRPRALPLNFSLDEP